MTNDLGNKEVMARNIKRFLTEQGYTRAELCELLKVSYSALADWLHCRTYPRIDKIERMAHIFGVSKAELVERDAIPERSAIMDVIGDISAGYDGIINEEKTGDKFAIPFEWIKGHNPREYMLLKVKGDSMHPLI